MEGGQAAQRKKCKGVVKNWATLAGWGIHLIFNVLDFMGGKGNKKKRKNCGKNKGPTVT